MSWRRILSGSVAAFCLLAALPDYGSAEPRGFRRTRSAFTVGLAVGDFYGGSIGSVSHAGFGLMFQEVITSGYFGGAARIGVVVYPTTKATIPFDEGFQAYTLSIGPRFNIPVTDALPLAVYLQPEYSFVGLQSNSVIREAGGNLLHSAGGLLGTTLHLGVLTAELTMATHYLFEVDDVALTWFVSVGVNGFL